MFNHEDREKEEEEPELLEEAVDMGFDELLELLREEPPQLSPPLLLQSKRLFSLGQKSQQQQEQELTPHATAVSEAIHQESLPAAPSLISTVQQQSWAPDLDASGEVSPDASRTSVSCSRSPVAMRNGYDIDSGIGQHSSLGQIHSNVTNLGLLGVDTGDHHPIVDLTASDSSGDEEPQSSLQEIDSLTLKRKLPNWGRAAPKRMRELSVVNWPSASVMWTTQQQSGGQSLTPSFLKNSGAESSSLTIKTPAWNPNPYKFPSRLDHWDHASSIRRVPQIEARENAGTFRKISYVTERSGAAETSTSTDRGVPRVLPPTLGGSTLNIPNGAQVGIGSFEAANLLKRSEEMAYQAVLQAFSLADEREETTPDKGLLAMPLLKHQKIALSWMQKRESGRQDPCGGILADDQGLGKTISTIALILKNRAPIDKQDLRDQKVSKVEHSTVDLVDDEDDQSVVKKQGTQEKPGVRNGAVQMSSANGSGGQQYDSQLFSKGRPAAGTLVVCPTSVLRQWAQEVHDKVTAAADLTVLIYHGSNRTKDPQELAKYDLVLSTYSIVSMEVPKQPVPDGKEKDEDKRDAFDYGFVPFAKPKKEKAEKAKKGKSKSHERLTEGRNDSSVPSDAGPLARVAWFRVVLDEAQSIKNCRTQVARATWGLRAKRRWCLSGTPIQNSVDDLFSYFRFLRYFPWDAYKKFCFDIKDPISRTPAEGYRRLQAILKPVVLRRTKTSLIDGQPIVKLPPRIVKLKQAEFSLEERSFYTKLEAESRAQFQVYAAAGTVQSNYVNILWMLLRLRQACDHPMLVKKCNTTQTAQTTAVDSVQKLSVAQRLDLIKYLDGDMAICVICQDAPEDPVVSICRHVFCRQCISDQFANRDDTSCRSPKCQRALNASLIYSLAALRDGGLESGSSTSVDEHKLVVGSRNGLESVEEEEEHIWNTSSKIDAVVSTLQALPKVNVLVEDGKLVKGTDPFLSLEPDKQLDVKESSAIMDVTSELPLGPVRQMVDSTEKAIVFSQWTSMLDLLEVPLKQAGFCYRRLDGTMSVLARDRAVSDFNTRPEVTVMIMSLKAASLGLNMVSACHVLLLDVWWNPTTEDQAIDRAHRIGQTRAVNVSRFTVKNTIEDRILALQERKRQIVSSAFGENDVGEQKNRLTVEDLRYLFRV